MTKCLDEGEAVHKIWLTEVEFRADTALIFHLVLVDSCVGLRYTIMEATHRFGTLYLG